ncbi:MAG: hypothetical protein WC969_14570 [Elusimicrobiota bacterium]|jgi:hypothetical protein
MWKTTEGSTGRLLQLCAAYFFFYVLTGVTVKVFTGPAAAGFPGMPELAFLIYSTFGSTLVCLGVIFAKGWHRATNPTLVALGPLRFPREYLYIIPSGVCTAVVIPTTTLMYMLPISVMVAMVIMRASVIIISRAVDEVQIRQGILHKKVFWEENAAVVFALCAAGVHLLMVKPGDFDFIHNPAAVAILSSYILVYSIRIYIMNYYKNTRPKGAPLDNKWFFSIEQIAATTVMLLATAALLACPACLGGDAPALTIFRDAVFVPHARWPSATLAGTAYGMVAFFSVFIFMFKGRTATFAGLVNRLTSLVAGTAATLLFWLIYGGKPPKPQDWISLGLILVAVAFLSSAEKRRAAELAAEADSGAPGTGALPAAAAACAPPKIR